MFRFGSYRCRAQILFAAAGLFGAGQAPVYAEVISFAGYQIEVDATVGEGENASVLVVDWDTFGGPYTSPTHAFLFKWDDPLPPDEPLTLLDMLTAFQTAGVFTFSGTAFIGNINYTDSDGDNHANPVSGNWELASGTNPFGQWEGYDFTNPDWDFNAAGADVELLADGQFEGINAAFYDPEQDYARVGTPLSVPVVPEPTSAVLLGLAGLALTRRRRR